MSRSLVAVSLMAGGFVAASFVSAAEGEQPRLVPAAAGETAAAPASAAETKARPRPAVKTRRPRHSTVKPAKGTRPKRKKPAAASRETSAAVERKILSVIVQSPAGKLSPALIDGKTGLAKNNLQAVCTRGVDSRSFLCVVRSALQPAAGSVYAQYRPAKKGRGSFTWYRSRRG